MMKAIIVKAKEVLMYPKKVRSLATKEMVSTILPAVRSTVCLLKAYGDTSDP